MIPGESTVRVQQSAGRENRAAVIILAMALSSIGLFARGFDNPLGQALSCLIGSLILAGIVAVFRPGTTFWRHIRWPVILIVSAILWLVAVALVRAVMPPEATDLPYAPDLFLSKFLSIVGGLWFLLAGRLIGREAHERHLAVTCIAIAITMFAASGMGMMLIPHGDFFPNLVMVKGGRFLGLAGNANVTASMCGAGALLCAGIGLPEWIAKGHAILTGRPWPIGRTSLFAMAGFAINIAALLLTASRLAFLATGLSLLLLCLHHGLVARLRMKTILQISAVAVVLIAGAVLLSSTALIERTAAIHPDAHIRWAFYRRFMGIAGTAPWTGLGPGAFPQANIYFLQNSTMALRETWIINSPHSILLQLWFVGGLPYLLMMGGGAALIVRDMVRRLDLRECGSRQIGLLLAIMVVFGVGLIDIPLDVTASADIALLLVGLAWARPGGEGGVPLSRGAA